MALRNDAIRWRFAQNEKYFCNFVNSLVSAVDVYRLGFELLPQNVTHELPLVLFLINLSKEFLKLKLISGIFPFPYCVFQVPLTAAEKPVENSNFIENEQIFDRFVLFTGTHNTSTNESFSASESSKSCASYGDGSYGFCEETNGKTN